MLQKCIYALYTHSSTVLRPIPEESKETSDFLRRSCSYKKPLLRRTMFLHTTKGLK